MRKFASVFILLLFSTLSAWADPVGVYDVKGTDLDGESYAGTVEVVKTGDVYALLYKYDDGTEQVGSAIGDAEFLAYGYAGENELGVGLMTAKGANWEGVWTNIGAEKMSAETWTRQ